jgi:predicted SnoaL-like aldol condensation-catalyzing enzyme
MYDPIALQSLVQAAMDGILVHHDRAGVRNHFHPDFVQHNPWADDGGAHVEAMCDFTFGVEMRRWIVQGDLVAYHGLYTAPNPLGEHPLVCVDVWRVQGGQIVEHWDALMPAPPEVAEVMLAGAGDGFADVPPAQVAANAANARRLWELGVRRRDAALIDALLAPSFTQHRPEMGDGRRALLTWAETNQPTVEVRMSVSSGDLVLLQLLVEHAGVARVVYDLYRFDADGRITDQWTVAQDRLPLAEAGNPHPHF